jgi:hypothetical protein
MSDNGVPLRMRRQFETPLGSRVTLFRMNTTELLSSIDSEIARLEQVPPPAPC